MTISKTEHHSTQNELLARTAPGLFVLLWSTGFIGSKFGSLYAEPFSMTSIRMALVVAILLVIALLMRAPWPKTPAAFFHLMVVGLLVHACYLCGILYALRLGVPVGFVAMIAGIQPILTAALGFCFLGETLRGLQLLGMAFGLGGVMLVIGTKFGFADASHLPVSGMFAAAAGLLGITLGTLYQKRFCTQIDLRTGGIVQYSATAVACLACAFAFETREVNWTQSFIGAIIWLAVVLSIGAIGLLFYMIRHGATAKVASLFFLTPSVTAVMAYVCFGEKLSVLAVLGFAVTAVGVALVVRTPHTLAQLRSN
jgi:drug/metabolite transporter (DMT)-like permease